MITDYLKYVNDQAYRVKRETAVGRFAQKGENKLNMDLLQAWRDYLGCNHVLRTPTHFLMCEEIEEATIIEEDVKN